EQHRKVCRREALDSDGGGHLLRDLGDGGPGGDGHLGNLPGTPARTGSTARHQSPSPRCCVRSTFLSSLPTEVRGSSSTNSTWSGSCHFANFVSRPSRSSSAETVSPSRRTT